MECCNSFNECNELITIGYLKDFIGSLIQDSSGRAISISTTSADAYCPTYDEIKALLPASSYGSNGPLDDVDGIVLNGSGRSTVKQQELSIRYTRFDSFTIAANPSTVGACSGTTNFSYVNKYKRYTKSMGGSCTTSTTNTSVNDTQNNRVSFTTSNFGTINGHTMTVGENPHGTQGEAPARSTTITGKVTFRGTPHTNTATVTQSALGGDYYYWYTDNGGPHSYSLTCTSSVSYRGGSASATGHYKVTYWDVYKWVDNCNHEFTGRTETRDTRTSSFTENIDSVTFSAVGCGGSGSAHTFTYHGNSCTSRQEDNPNACKPCPRSQSCNSSNCGEDITKYYGCYHDIDGNCHCNQERETCPDCPEPPTGCDLGVCDETAHTSYEVYTTEFSNVSVNGERNVEVGIENIKCTQYYDREPIETNVQCPIYIDIPAGECDTSGSLTEYDTTFTWAYEECGPTPPQPTECTCDDLQFVNRLSWGSSDMSYKNIVNGTPDDCIDFTTITVDNLSYFNYVKDDSNKSINVQPKNAAGSDVREETITIHYTADGNQCTGQVNLKQMNTAYTCNCSSMSITTTHLTWGPEEDSSDSFAIYEPNRMEIDGECPNIWNTVTFGQMTHFTVSKTDDYGQLHTRAIIVAPKGSNTSETTYEDTLSINYSTDDNPNCNISIPLKQLGVQCSCESIKSDITLYDYNGDTHKIGDNDYTGSTTVPTGATQGPIKLAHVRVEDCGEASPSTNSTDFFQNGVRKVENGSGFDIYTDGILQGENQGTYRIVTHSAEKSCQDVIITVRKGSAPTGCTCAEASNLRVNSELNSLPCYLGGTYNIFEPNTIADCLVLEPSADVDWISFYPVNVNGIYKYNGMYAECTDSARSGHITCRVTKDGVECGSPIVIDVNQAACTPCTCSTLPSFSTKGNTSIEVSNAGHETIRIFYEANGDLPDGCKCGNSDPIGFRITTIDMPGSEVVDSWTSGSSYSGLYYIDILTSQNPHGVTTIVPHIYLNGRECPSVTFSGSYILHVAGCSCDDASGIFEGQTTPTKNVSSKPTTVSWSFNDTSECFDLRNCPYSQPTYDWVSFNVSSNGVIANVTSENTTSSERTATHCVYIVCSSCEPEVGCGSSIDLKVIQAPCNCCDDYSMSYSSQSGFTDCSGTQGGYSSAWYEQNSGSSAVIARIDKPSTPCITIDDPTVYDSYGILSVRKEDKGSYYNIWATINSVSNFPGDSILYEIHLNSSGPEGSCHYDGSPTLYFRLYKNCTCSPGVCDNYLIANNVSLDYSTPIPISTGVRKKIGTVTTLPSDRCLMLSAYTPSSTETVEIEDNGDLYITSTYQGSTSTEFRIKVLHLDNGTWKDCNGNQLNIAIKIN